MILAAARQRPAGGHSALYEWMWQRAADLAVELDPPRTPNWQAMAEAFGREGVTDGQGGAPSAETVRKTWWKVRKDRKRQAEGATRRTPPARRTPPPPPLQETAPATKARAPEEEEPARPTFGFARPRT